METAIIIAVAALVVAIVAYLFPAQMIWGKHKLKVSYIGKEYYLDCQIQSIPSGKILKCLAVERNIVQDLSVNVTISNKTIGDEFDGLIYGDRGIRLIQFGNDLQKWEKHIILPASVLSAKIRIANGTGMKAWVIDEDNNSAVELKGGIYTVRMQILADGKITEKVNDFQYDSVKGYLSWIEPVTSCAKGRHGQN